MGYLDHLDTDWVQFYNNEPFSGAPWTPETEKYVIGGEACAWAEQMNQWNVIPRAFPRTCATAERLWSPIYLTDASQALLRLQEQICRMNRRGIASAPLTYGSCT